MATGILNQGDYTIEDDSNGDLVITDENDNTVLKWDKSIPGWTFNNNSIEGLSSVSTDNAIIGGSDVWREIGRVTSGFDNSTFDFSLSQRKEYRLIVSVQLDDTTRVYARLDSNNNGIYQYDDDSYTTQTGQTEWLIAENQSGSDFASITSILHISPSSYNTAATFWGYTASVQGYRDRITAFSRSGTSPTDSFGSPSLNVTIDGTVSAPDRCQIVVEERDL